VPPQLSPEEISFAQRVHFVVTFGSVSPVALSPTFHASAAAARKGMKITVGNFIVALEMLRKDKRIGKKSSWIWRLMGRVAATIGVCMEYYIVW